MADLGNAILWVSLAVAVGFSAGVVAWLKWVKPLEGFRCGAPLGPADWDFSESWASNLTLVGALLGTVLAESDLVPEVTTYLPRTSYGGLNVLFGIITVLAPLVYVALRTARSTVNENGEPDVQYQGRVCGFMIASCLTLWAVLGQLPTVALLLQEMAATGAFPSGTTYLLWALPLIGIILLIVYFCKTTYSVVKHQLERSARVRQRIATARGMDFQRVSESEVSLPSWSVL